MIKNGLYKLNENGLRFLKMMECNIIKNIEETKVNSRPMYYGLASKKDNDIFYLIPLMTIRSNSQEIRIDRYLLSNGLSKNYYEKIKVMNTMHALKISSVFVVDSTMIEEWKIQGNVYIYQNRHKIDIINQKLNTMLVHYFANPKHSENHVVESRNYLLLKHSKNSKE